MDINIRIGTIFRAGLLQAFTKIQRQYNRRVWIILPVGHREAPMLKDGLKGRFGTTFQMGRQDIDETSGDKVAIKTSASIRDRTQINPIGIKQTCHLLKMGYQIRLMLEAMLRYNSIILIPNLVITTIRQYIPYRWYSIGITLWNGPGPCHQLSCIQIIGVVNDNSGATKKLHGWTIKRPDLQHRAAGPQALKQVSPRGNRRSVIPIATTLLLPMQPQLGAAQSP